MVEEALLREILEDFYDRVFADRMIGFYFQGRSKERLVEKELELTRSILGESIKYTGKPMKEAHFPLRIMGGHFDRRNQILKETIEDHNLCETAARRWLEHARGLRNQITRDGAGECVG